MNVLFLYRQYEIASISTKTRKKTGGVIDVHTHNCNNEKSFLSMPIYVLFLCGIKLFEFIFL